MSERSASMALKSAPSAPAGGLLLQRKCACGTHTPGGGECAECGKRKRAESIPRGQALAVGQPGDRFEQEADRMAAWVMNGGGPVGLPSFFSTPSESVQRDGDGEPKAPKPDNYDEAAKKIGDALQATAIGKQLKAKAGELGGEFLSSVEGKVVAGTALGGALAAIIATNSELPVQVPEIPLDFITPGLKAKLIYKGPVRHPTNVSFTLTSKSGASVSASYTQIAAAHGKPAETKAGLTLAIPWGGSPTKPEPKGSDSDKYRAETARMAAEQRKSSEGLKTPAQKTQDKADEQAFLNSYLRFRANDPLNSLDARNKKDDPMLMRKATANSADAGVAPPIVHETLAGSGHPLDFDTRTFMEERFGHDFSRVRIHTDTKAAESAREMGAHAYTVGSSIVFGRGGYAPETQAGRRLIAHELTHVAQQGGSVRALQRENRDPDEVAAEGKEDADIVAKAKRALASKKPDFAVHEVVWRLINNHHLDEHFELSGSRYDKKRKGLAIEFTDRKSRTQGTIVVGDEILDRLAKGQSAAVVKEIAAQIGKVDMARGGIDYVFIMGADAPKSGNRFYTEAVIYFRKEHPGATMIEDVRDLEGINQRINSEGKPVANLIIVSHAHPDGTLQFSLDPADKTPRQVQYSELKEANEKHALTQPKPDLIGFWTHVSIRGCNLGRSTEMLDELQTAFGGKARVIAPTHAQRYGGGTQSLAGPHYEEPGISKFSNKEAFKRIKAKPEYAFITDWRSMEKKIRRFTENTTEVVFRGPFPRPGNEISLLVDQKGRAFATRFKFASSSRVGDKTEFVYTAKGLSRDGTREGDVTIAMETPPGDEAAVDMARAKVARPDTYAFKVNRKQTGLQLEVGVAIQKTEWELYHAEIHKQGKGFNPREGTPTWFGDTDR